MWGKLNLPIFLFNVGLLTLININALMVLAKPCPSLPIMRKLSWLVGWPVLLLWWCTGQESFRCSLNLSAKVLEVSPMYSSLQVRSPHWNQYMAQLLLTMGSLSLRETSRLFDSAINVEVGLYTMSPTDLFNVFAETLGVGYYYMTLGFNFIGNGLGTCGALAISLIINLTGWPAKPFLHLFQSPFRVFTMGKCFAEMLHFLLEKIRIVTNSFGPMDG